MHQIFHFPAHSSQVALTGRLYPGVQNSLFRLPPFTEKQLMKGYKGQLLREFSLH